MFSVNSVFCVVVYNSECDHATWNHWIAPKWKDNYI